MNEIFEEAEKEVGALPSKEVRKRVIMKTLTEKETLFCREYITHRDGKRALLATGYQGNFPGEIARRWLMRPRIRQHIERLAQKDELRLDMTRDKYHEMLMQTYQRAMADGDYTGANRAAELLGKSLGYFVEQKAVLNMSAKVPEDRAQQMQEVQRLAKIAGVTLE